MYSRFCRGLLPLLGLLVVAASGAAETKRMNVLFIISDDLRAEIASYGSPLAQTPNIDRLGAQGVRFDRAYCNYPLCAPSRSSMLMGRYPTTTRVYGNREWVGGKHPDWTSLPAYFRQQGYTTLRTGKVFHGGIDDTDAWTEGGETRLYGLAGPGGTPTPSPASRVVTKADADEHVETMVKADRNRASESDRWEAVQGDAIQTQGDTLVTDKALDYLRAHAKDDAPFFLACGLSKPHSPLVAPANFFELYQADKIPLPIDFAPRPTVPAGFPVGSIRPNNADLFIARDATPDAARDMIRAYLACISYVDWNIGRVVAELERLGLRDNTIIVFWSDHGYQLGEKGKWSKAGSLWEQGTRVPFIIHDPRLKGNGRTSTRIVQAIDIYPTLVDLCGLPAVPGLEGASLRPLLDEPTATWAKPAYTVWNERNRGITGVVVRTERWRYAEYFGPGAGAFLTDPVNDPHELKNLVNEPENAAVVQELAALARAHVAGQTEQAK